MFEHLFAINGTWLFPPDSYQEEPLPIVGYTTNRKPIRQGKGVWVFGWALLRQEHMSRLMNMYSPTNPEVIITYLDKSTGNTATMIGMMEEPLIAQRMSIFYGNVSVRFTHCESS